MLIIRKNQTNDFVVSASQNRTLQNANYLFEFTHILSRETVSFYPQLILKNNRYDKFRFVEGTTDNLSLVPPQVNFPYVGQYYYTIYQSTGTTLNPSLTQGEIETGRCVVIVNDDQEQDCFFQSFQSDNETNQNIIFLTDQEISCIEPVEPSPTPTNSPTPTLTPSSTPPSVFCVGAGFDYRPTTVKYQNGFFYVGGGFEFYQGNRAPLMVKINPTTGQIVNDFYSSIPFTFGNTGLIINDIEFLSNGKFFAGGFYQLGGVLQGLNLFNSDGSVDTSFQIPQSINNNLRSICINSSEDRVYIGGAFTTPTGRIEAYDLSGNVDPSFSGKTTGFNTAVNTIERDASDNLFVGGGFVSYNGIGGGNRRLCKLDQYGNVDNTFFTGMGTGVDDGIVYDLLLDGGWVYIVGTFTSVNGVSKNRIARIDQITGIVDPLWGGGGITSPQVSISNVAIEKNPQTNDFIITVSQSSNGTVFYDGTQVFGRVFSVDTLGLLNPAFGSTTDPDYGFNDYTQPNVNAETEIAFNPDNGDIVFVGDFDAFSAQFMPKIVLTDKYGTSKSTSDCYYPRVSSTPVTATPTPTQTNTPTISPTQTPTNSSTPTPTPTITSTQTQTPTLTPTNTTTPTETPTQTPTPTSSLPIPVFEPEYEAILDRAFVSGFDTPALLQKIKQNNLIVDLKNAGLWNKLGVFYMFKLDTSDGVSPGFSLINWITPSAALCSLQTYSAPAYPTMTSNSGWTFTQNSALYLGTNTPFANVNAINLTTSGSSEGLYYVEYIGPSTSGLDTMWTTDNNSWNRAYYEDTTQHRIFQNSPVSSYDFTGLGFKAATIEGRADTDTTILFRNNGITTSRSKSFSDVQIGGGTMRINGRNSGETHAWTIGMWFSAGGASGNGFFSSDVQALETIINAYMTS